MSYLLDSDALIYFFNEKEPWHSSIDDLLEEEENIFVSIVSVMETCAGWSEEQRLVYLPKLYALFTIAPVTPAIAERAGALRYEGNHPKKRKPKPIDALIAATAIEHRYRLVTNNRQDFTMPGLKLWRDQA